MPKNKPRNGQFRCVVFDLGYTLFYRLPEEEIFNNLLVKEGIDVFTVTQVKEAMGRSQRILELKKIFPETYPNGMESYWTLKNKTDLECLGLKGDLESLAYKIQHSWYNDAGVGLYKDSVSTLQQLKKMGLKIALLSNSFREEIIMFFNRHSVPVSLFDAIAGFDTFRAAKPSPAGLLGISKQLGLLPSELVMVGDHVKIDGKAAKDAGAGFIHIVRDTKKSTPSWAMKVRSLEEIPGLLN